MTEQKDVLILAIESSCDETAASVVKNGREVLSNVISSQIDLHTLYGGVVPEIASRKHIEKINQVIEEALKDVQKNLPHDVRISTDIFRQSRFIESSINNVQRSLIEGGVFVIIVLFLFLGNVRTTIISVVTIPLALIASLLALHFMGLTINTMSLGGLAIAIGSLVDDAIVDVENVYKRLRENRALPIDEQRPIESIAHLLTKCRDINLCHNRLLFV